MRRAVRLGAALVVVLGVWLAGRPAGVAAHGLLARADPSPDARLRQAPASVTAWFTEPLEAGISTLRVLDGSGEQVDRGPVEVDARDPTAMTVPLRDGLGPGFYRVTWQTLSRIDGHIWFGSYEFAVLNLDGSLPAGPRVTAGSVEARRETGVAEHALTKLAQLLGAVMLVGGLTFALVVARPAAGTLPGDEADRARALAGRLLVRLTLAAVLLLVLAGAAELLLQARELGGLGTVRTVLGLTWSERWLDRQLILAGVAVALALAAWLRQRAAANLCLWAALIGGVGYLLNVSAVSHAAAVAQGSFWATAADFAHLLAATVWIGGLVQLVLFLHGSRRAVSDAERPRLLATMLQRFSLLAATSVVLLLATGVFSALVEVARWPALVETAYGRALLAKLALLVPLLAVAALNAVLFRPRLVQAATGAQGVERLRRTIARLTAAEAALGVAVLLAVGVLVWYAPARAAGQAAGEAATAGGRDPFAYPLTAGNWGLVAGMALVAGGALLWVWSGRWRRTDRDAQELVRTAALGLPLVGLLIGLVVLFPRTQATGDRAGGGQAPSARTPAAAAGWQPQPSAFTAALALRYEAATGEFVLLEVAPFQVGENTFRVTVLDRQGQPVAVDRIALRLSRLEEEGGEREVEAARAAETRGWLAEAALPSAGWWAIDVAVAGRPAASFFVRLDAPSRAPLVYAPPDYETDPAAQALFRRTVRGYEGLRSLRWREELTSGLLQPAGIGAWVVTDGEAAAPDKVRLHVLSPGASDYELVRVRRKSCTQDRGRPWRCTEVEAEAALDLAFQEPATAFRLGRREMVDGEMSRVLLFYNPSQPAWYAWWVGEERGDLRRQAMVAAGHFMLTRFLGHNAPVEIRLPPQAQ